MSTARSATGRVSSTGRVGRLDPDATTVPASGRRPVPEGRQPHRVLARGGRPAKRCRVRSLGELRPLVKEGRYRVGPHASKHAACEGFTEQDMVKAVLYGKELLRYLEDERMLVLGYICPSPNVKIPLHVVLDYAKPRWVDVVTAFIPDDAHRVISRARLAELLRYDRDECVVELVGRAA
ncbi:MAG TPA: hypothetical protein VF171_00170 [Trueperaceae bacterium]